MTAIDYFTCSYICTLITDTYNNYTIATTKLCIKSMFLWISIHIANNKTNRII